MTKFYAVVRHIAKAIFVLNGAQIIGKENLLPEQAMLVICNHASSGDLIALAGVLPYNDPRFIAKEAFAKKTISRSVFGGLGAIFLSESDNDLAALRRSIKELKEGHPLVIFPEGTRHFDQNVGKFQPGAAYIAQRAQVRVVPVSVLNCGDLFRFWRRNIIIRIGTPIDPPAPGMPKSETLAEHAENYFNIISEMTEQSKQEILRQNKPMRAIPKSRQNSGTSR